MYNYKCKVVRVVDGDTIDVDIDLGLDVTLRKQRLRLADIDAPERYHEDGDRATTWLRHKLFFREKLEDEGVCYIQTYKKGSFGRYLATIWLTEDDYDGNLISTTLNDMMVKEGYAVPYVKRKT